MPAEKMPEEELVSLSSPPGSAVSTPTASPRSSIVKEMHELDEESATPRLLETQHTSEVAETAD